MRTAILTTFLLAALPAAAQDPADREAAITLLMSTVAARTLVSTAIDECTTRYADMVDPALDAKMEWEARNQPLEQKARELAGRYGAKIAAQSSFLGYEVQRKALLESTEAKTASNTRETMARNFAVSTEAQKVAACKDLVKSVHDGKMDFAVTQPNAYKLLQSSR